MHYVIKSHVLALLLFIIPAAVNADENPAVQHLTILHTKDLHGRFLDHNEQNKNLAALMSGFFRKTKADNANVLTLDTGNFSPNYQYAKIADRKMIVTLMAKMGYDALNIGSHELDEGLTQFIEMLHASHVALVSENIEFTSADTHIQPYIIKEFHGLKVGIIGFIGSDYATNYINDKDMKIIAPNEHGRLTKLVRKLKTETDVIIILANGSIDNILKVTESLSGSNIVVLVGWGVSKDPYNNNANHLPGRPDSPLFLFTDSNNINQLNLTLSNKKIKDYSLRPVEIAQLEKEDEAVAQETSALIEKRKQYYEHTAGIILSDIDARRWMVSNQPTNAISLLAQPIKEKWKEVDCVVINSGAIYSYQNDVIKASPMSVDALSRLYPFMNTIVIAKLSGRDIKSMLERSSSYATFSQVSKAFSVHQMRSFLQSSGLKYTVDFSKESQQLSGDGKETVLKEGNRVSDIQVNQKPLYPNAYYMIATNDYVFGGGDGYTQFKNAKDVVKTGINTQDLMQDYLKSHSPVTLDPPDTIIFLNRNESDFQHVGPAYN